MRRRRFLYLVSAALLLGTTATTAQPLPCTSVAAEVRDYIRSRGACRDVKAAPRPRAAAKPKPVAADVPAPAAATVDKPESTPVRPESEASHAGAASSPPVEPPAAAAAAPPAPAPTPAASLAPALAPVPEPRPNPIDPPDARGPFPTPFPVVAALTFGAGIALGLMAGALLMRRWLLRGTSTVAGSAPPPALLRLQQPVDQRPNGADADSLLESSTTPDISFTAWLVPVATTIELAPPAGGRKFHSSERATTTLEQVRLLAPIEVSGDCIESVLCERIGDKSVSAQVLDRLHGFAAECAAAELNRALDVDALDVLSQGWVQLPAMHEAVQLSAVTRGPPVVVDVDMRHTIASTAHVVLATHVAGRSLSPLELLLEIVVDVEGAALAAREGGIELVDIGEATVRARLTVGSTLIKEHQTEISYAPRDPSSPRQPRPERPASVDIPI